MAARDSVALSSDICSHKLCKTVLCRIALFARCFHTLATPLPLPFLKLLSALLSIFLCFSLIFTLSANEDANQDPINLPGFKPTNSFVATYTALGSYQAVKSPIQVANGNLGGGPPSSEELQQLRVLL
uniref:Uncharacterized protein n=1 Tax=Manihot esculenta TaxID=3983 RepID=A0A2C9VY36_MANES